MSDELVTLRHFLRQDEAHLAVGMLEGEGIAAFIQDAQLNQIYGNVLGGVRLQVAEKDFERAKELLDGLSPTPTEPDAA